MKMSEETIYAVIKQSPDKKIGGQLKEVKPFKGDNRVAATYRICDFG